MNAVSPEMVLSARPYGSTHFHWSYMHVPSWLPRALLAPSQYPTDPSSTTLVDVVAAVPISHATHARARVHILHSVQASAAIYVVDRSEECAKISAAVASAMFSDFAAPLIRGEHIAVYSAALL